MLQLIQFFNLIIIFVCCNGWSPAGNRLKTRWTSEINPNNVWPEYPRPQLKRENNWINLNGLWNYSITSIETTKEPTKYDGEILVPFPIESSLSGVQQAVYDNQTLWYHKVFNLFKKTSENRYIIHFGAVDYHTKLNINGLLVGEHIGGYDSFNYDITDYIIDSNEQKIVLRVTDANAPSQPAGKQRLYPDGIWFTCTTGIWQTVWLEIVPKLYIKSIKITPDIDSNSIELVINTNTPNDHSSSAKIKITDTNMNEVIVNENYEINSAGRRLKITNPILWSTTNPHLYTLHINYHTDVVTSYFGMRKIEFKRDKNGIFRFFLNNNSMFMFGTFDQGYWPDGVYLAPNDDALKYDIEVTKQFGFNTIRKHVKVEPDRWYYWTDKMGILVWQDFPCAWDNKPTDKNKKQVELEMHRMVKQLYNHPSIIMWEIFHNDWGRYDTKRIIDLYRRWDKSRIIKEEIESQSDLLHQYSCGDLKVSKHSWDPSVDHTDSQNVDKYGDNQKRFIDSLAILRANAIFRLRSSIYVQITDVETEQSGLMTYDRDVIKVNNVTEVSVYVNKLYSFQSISWILLAGHFENQEWHYTTVHPSKEWMQPNYDSFGWKVGKAGFGSVGTPSITINTDWNTHDIWLRKEFVIPTGMLPKHPVLYIFHDGSAQVYINGIEILANILSLWLAEYAAYDLETNLFKEGKNIIAIHCHNVHSEQGIDAGIIDIQMIDAIPSSKSTNDSINKSQSGNHMLLNVGIPLLIAIFVTIVIVIISIVIYCHKRKPNAVEYSHNDGLPTQIYDEIDNYYDLELQGSNNNNNYLDIL